MKVAYIGENDCLTDSVLKRLKKEEYEIFFLTRESGGKTRVNRKNYHSYTLSQSRSDMKRIFSAIAPDVVIYEGVGFLDAEWDDKQKQNFSLLTTVLDECCCRKDVIFFMFSSVEVYGTGRTAITEEAVPDPVSCKGMYLSEEE